MTDILGFDVLLEVQASHQADKERFGQRSINLTTLMADCLTTFGSGYQLTGPSERSPKRLVVETLKVAVL